MIQNEFEKTLQKDLKNASWCSKWWLPSGTTFGVSNFSKVRTNLNGSFGHVWATGSALAVQSTKQRCGK